MGEIGFMQGRLCEPVNGKIQAFPREHWQDEFHLAGRLGFPLMEWTLDQDGLRQNPIMTVHGRERVRALCAEHGVKVRSLTGDCFMQAPFHKSPPEHREALLADLKDVIAACAALEIRLLVVPLVDNGALDTAAHGADLRAGLLPLAPLLCESHVKIVFESDFSPLRLAGFIDQFPSSAFGINYDIGNSAALGFDPAGEIRCYGLRICNVHIKDRTLGGTTVPLGEGNADFPTVFRELKRAHYAGDFILQTARAADGDHAGALCRYRDMVRNWWSACEARA